jgi:hypothetical protein
MPQCGATIQGPMKLAADEIRGMARLAVHDRSAGPPQCDSSGTWTCRTWLGFEVTTTVEAA